MSRFALVLGSAQDGGVPQFGSAASGLPARAASSIAVVSGDKAVLLDASPDLRAQSQLLRAAAGDVSIEAVVLTHAHMGHYTGLVHLGREAGNTAAVRTICTPSMAHFLRRNQPWRQLIDLVNITVVEAEPGDLVPVVPGLDVRLHLVPHRGEHTDTVAVSLPGALLYVPDIDDWDGWPPAKDMIAAHAVSLVDATFYSAEELQGRSIADIPHPLVPDTVARFRALTGSRRIILTHLNHTNPLCDPAAPERELVAAAGFETAEDGMRIEL